MVNCDLDHVADIGLAKASIQDLDLSSNRLKQIGALDFSGWSSLETINFSDNRLTGRESGREGKQNLQGIPRGVKHL